MRAALDGSAQKVLRGIIMTISHMGVSEILAVIKFTFTRPTLMDNQRHDHEVCLIMSERIESNLTIW